MTILVGHVVEGHPLNGLIDALKQRILEAQSDGVDEEFSSAYELCSRAMGELRIAVAVPQEARLQTASEFGDQPSKVIVAYFLGLLRRNGVPDQAAHSQAATISHRLQLLRAFRDPDAVIAKTCQTVTRVLKDFPRSAANLRVGRNPGDVLDPYILSAARVLMCSGDFERTVSAATSHKVLMIIEGLLGHMHEDLIGAMRGNVRAPEPRGRTASTLNALRNPFPGADVIQPPLRPEDNTRFF